MKKYKCLVIDDEELARTLLETYIAKVDFLELVAKIENPLEAFGILSQQSIDLLFLDIQMPEIKGTELAKIITTETRIIFTTAYSEYALEGYDLNALDYLLKPITFERFLKAANKIRTDQRKKIDTTLTVKSGYDLHKLNLEDINYVMSDGEYVVFHLDQQKIMSYQSLKSLEKKLPVNQFMRVHRSFIINKSKVNALKGKDIILGDATIPVSARYFEKVKSNLFD